MTPRKPRVERLVDRPIIAPHLHPSIGVNIQGPSLIRVPDWIEDPLGRYYLYFADHKGRYIRLAYADRLDGPWRIHPPGSLHLKQTPFPSAPPPLPPAQLEALERRMAAGGLRIGHSARAELTTPHIASPDVHVDDAQRRIVMVYHGLEAAGLQLSRFAWSSNGIDFTARPDAAGAGDAKQFVPLGRTYMRVFRYGRRHYALAMPGQFYRTPEQERLDLSELEEGPLLFNPDMRHCAVLVRNATLHVFWTQVGEAPERILLSTVDLGGDWRQWRQSEAVEVLRPERHWEGADAPAAPSVRSTAYGLVNQLRDPAVYEEDGGVYLLYAVGGESGIGIARLTL